MEKKRFSKRQGFKGQEKEITIRYEAPQGLREFVIQTVKALGYSPDFTRQIVCQELRTLPDKNNWSPYPNIFNETVELVTDCDWFYVYDIIEAIYKSLKEKDRQFFEDEINDYFVMNGIGWKMENGVIEIRGDENFEIELSNAVKVLDEAQQSTAKEEIREALLDLSRRPKPDITGAVQHSLACLECVVRKVSGNSKMTLGELIKKFPGIVPKPLDEAITKLWGFTSEQGRHLKEGGEPTFEDAELVVGISAILSTYLGKKIISSKEESGDPF